MDKESKPTFVLNMNNSFFQLIHKQKNLTETFRLYDEQVNFKLAMGLKKVSHMVVGKLDEIIENKVK